MTIQEFARQWYLLASHDSYRSLSVALAHGASSVEHVTLEGDGLEDYHSSDRARLMLEVGYWGTLEV